MRIQIGKGPEHEPALVHQRVRYDQIGAVDDALIVEQQVQIKRPRAPLDTLPDRWPPRVGFDRGQLGQQGRQGQVGQFLFQEQLTILLQRLQDQMLL